MPTGAIIHEENFHKLSSICGIRESFPLKNNLLYGIKNIESSIAIYDGQQLSV